jgi:hypothetical protein
LKGGGVPILGQSLQSHFETPSPSHEEVLATSLEPEFHLYDVIERIEMLSLDDNSSPSHSVEKLGPSQRGPPKWLTKTLESVHLDEVRKIRTRISSRQYGGNVDNSNPGDLDNMDVSCDCELNYLLTLDQLALKNPLLMMNGKNPCGRNMILSSRIGHGSWWTLHLEPNQLDASGYSRTTTNQMDHFTSTNHTQIKAHGKRICIEIRCLL